MSCCKKSSVASSGRSEGSRATYKESKQQAARAAETVVMASSDKLNAASPYMIGALELASTIIVEKSTQASLIEPLTAAGVTMVKA